MKKKFIFTTLMVIALCCTVAIPAIAKVKTKEVQKKEKAFVELESLKDELEALADSKELSNKEENQYKELVEEIVKKEIECETYDYKAEIQMRIDTIKTAISDNKVFMSRDGVSKEDIKECKFRNKKLSQVVEKHEKLLEEDNIDYQKLSEQLDDELNQVYDKIND